MQPPFASVLDHLQRLPDALVVELGVLTAEETAELARAHGATDAGQIDTVVALAEGNPLATVEMASAGAHGGETPASVRAAVQAQWAALSAEAQRMLGAAAVIGSQIPHALLSRVSHANVAPTLQEGSGAVQEVLAMGLLQSTESGYRFRHALDRRAVYELLLPEERIRLHERVARYLSAQLEGRSRAQLAAEVAAHWLSTGKAEESVAACIDAGMAAYEVGAYPEALVHLDNGLTKWDAGADGHSHLPRPIPEIAAAVFESSHSPEERTRGIRLLDSLTSRCAGDDLARVLSWLGRLCGNLGDRSAGEHAFERGVAAARTSWTRSEVLARYADYVASGGDTSKSRALLDEALVGFRGEDSSGHAVGLLCLASLKAVAGDKDGALRAVGEAREMALRLGDEIQVWTALSEELAIFDLVDEPRACLAAALQIVERARRGRLVRSQRALTCLSNAAEALLIAGRWDESLALIDDVCGDRDPASESEGGLHAQKGLIQLRRGEAATARRCLSRARHVTGSEWINSWVDLYRFEAEEHSWAGDPAAALVAVTDGIDRLGLTKTDVGIHVVPFIMIGLRATADAAAVPPLRGRALALAAILDAVVADVVARPQAGGALWIRAHTSLAVAESARGRGVDEPAQWRRAVEAWQARLNPYDVAYCQFREAESRVRHGDRRGAQAPLRDALATASQLRAAPLSDALTALARRARIPVSAEREQQAAAVPPRAAAAGLTQRECEVLRLLLDGLTNRQIARSLTISERTVGVHVSNVLGKLGVHSRAQAAALTHSSRLLADD